MVRCPRKRTCPHRFTTTPIVPLLIAALESRAPLDRRHLAGLLPPCRGVQLRAPTVSGHLSGCCLYRRTQHDTYRPAAHRGSGEPRPTGPPASCRLAAALSRSTTPHPRRMGAGWALPWAGRSLGLFRQEPAMPLPMASVAGGPGGLPQRVRGRIVASAVVLLRHGFPLLLARRRRTATWRRLIQVTYVRE